MKEKGEVGAVQEEAETWSCSSEDRREEVPVAVSEGGGSCRGSEPA